MHDPVTAGVGGLLMLIALVRNLGYRTQTWRARQRDRWGRRHLAHVPMQWPVAVDRQLRSHRRLDVALTWWLLAMCYIFQTPSSRAWAAWLGVVPGVLVLARGLVIARTASALPSGSRVARMPEPAENANQLYVHDAFRADALRRALAVTAMSAMLLVLAVPAAVGMPAERAIGYIEFVAIVALCLSLIGFFPDRPVAQMRARLWPALGPEQLVMPEDAVLSQGIAP
jgi:hypothetical protein